MRLNVAHALFMRLVVLMAAVVLLGELAIGIPSRIPLWARIGLVAEDFVVFLLHVGGTSPSSKMVSRLLVALEGEGENGLRQPGMLIGNVRA